MTKEIKVKRESQTIDQIIHSLKTYGLGDIRHNKEKTIAVFILSICFIDQLASFRYRGKNLTNKWEQFIKDYMPIYVGLNIYKDFRNTLIHNYSGTDLFGLTNDVTFVFPFVKNGKTTIINTDIFIQNLEAGFNEFEKDVRTPNSEANYNAIKRSITHPVLTHTRQEFQLIP